MSEPIEVAALSALGEIVSEYAHACPHCPAGRPEWVVGVGELPEIVLRAFAEYLDAHTPLVSQWLLDSVSDINGDRLPDYHASRPLAVDLVRFIREHTPVGALAATSNAEPGSVGASPAGDPS